MKSLVVLFLVLFPVVVFSQHIVNVNEIEPDTLYDNIHIKKLDTDSNATSFIIWIKKSVQSHKHEKHSERLYVLAGEGAMTIGDKTFAIKSGDYFTIQENTFHSLTVTSEIPVKVISVQAPEFFGKDRIFEE